MSKPGWQSKLSRPISLKTGTKLETLADARAFILDTLPESDQDRSSWQHATELLIEAAERGGSIEATTEQIERALFLQGMWMPKWTSRLSRTRSRSTGGRTTALS